MKIIAVTMLFLLVGCNTIHGMGRDIRGAGNAISNSSDDAKKRM